jgi:hypothetical protein
MRVLPTLAELRAMSEEELIRRHDEHETWSAGPGYYLDELARRDAARQTAIMVRSTETIRRLTWCIAGLTLVVTVLTAISVVIVAGSGG